MTLTSVATRIILTTDGINRSNPLGIFYTVPAGVVAIIKELMISLIADGEMTGEIYIIKSGDGDLTQVIANNSAPTRAALMSIPVYPFSGTLTYDQTPAISYTLIRLPLNLVLLPGDTVRMWIHQIALLANPTISNAIISLDEQ